MTELSTGRQAIIARSVSDDYQSGIVRGAHTFGMFVIICQ